MLSRWLAVLTLSTLSVVAQATCHAQLSEPNVDFGPLFPGRAGTDWHSAVRVAQLTITCEQVFQPGFEVQGVPASRGWAFGQGSLRASLGDALLDGQPVTLIQHGPLGEGSAGIGTGLVPGQTWRAVRPGRLLQVPLFIEATLPWQAWQVRDRYEAHGALVIRAQ